MYVKGIITIFSGVHLLQFLSKLTRRPDVQIILIVKKKTFCGSYHEI